MKDWWKVYEKEVARGDRVLRMLERDMITHKTALALLQIHTANASNAWEQHTKRNK